MIPVVYKEYLQTNKEKNLEKWANDKKDDLKMKSKQPINKEGGKAKFL